MLNWWFGYKNFVAIFFTFEMDATNLRGTLATVSTSTHPSTNDKLCFENTEVAAN
jgi:hypothetical protein